MKGRLKKQPALFASITANLNPNSHLSSLPWERARERATSRKAGIGAVRVLGKIAAIWRIPSPQPSPTGEGADCSRFRRCRPSEKRMPKPQRQEFFRQLLSQDRWNKRRKRFFRRPLNPSVATVFFTPSGKNTKTQIKPFGYRFRWYRFRQNNHASGHSISSTVCAYMP